MICILFFCNSSNNNVMNVLESVLLSQSKSPNWVALNAFQRPRRTVVQPPSPIHLHACKVLRHYLPSPSILCGTLKSFL